MSELRAVRDRGISNPVSIYLVSIYLVLALATILAGLGLRLLRLGLPFAVVKWGGSVLWAAMVYWLTAALMPRSRVLPAALTAGAIAGLVECVRLYHSPGLDAFRLTLAGKLLLGRVFSPWHPVVYWAAIAIAAAFDRRLLRRLERAQR